MNFQATRFDRRKQSIYLPTEIYAELVDVAAREDRSMSFLLQRALMTAWPTITALLGEAK